MTTPTQVSPVPSPSLDAARERVVRLLTDRYADDTLTVEAFEARLDRMHALTSVEALDAMANELTAAGANAVRPAARIVPSAPPALDARLPAYVPARAPLAPPDRVVAILSNTRRTGAWEVPEHVGAVSVMSELLLDLRDSRLPGACAIEVFALMGNVKLRLPPGAQVRVEVSSVMANVDDRTERRVAGGMQDGPVVRVTGVAIMAEVKVLRG